MFYLALRAMSDPGRSVPVHKNIVEAGLCQSRQERVKYQVKLHIKLDLVSWAIPAPSGRMDPQSRKGVHACCRIGSSGRTT